LLLSTITVSSGAEGPATPIDLDLYAGLLETHTRVVDDVAGVRVDYRGLASSTDWSRLVRQVEAARPSRMGRDERIAYWINAYNILAIDLILRHYPIASIKDIGSFFTPVWKKAVAEIEGESISLGQIEHEILRPMGEARIHASIVCASTSCPALARTPFRADSLDADLTAAMRSWLASPTKGMRIDRAAKRLTISKIFDWFEEDFEATGGVVKTIATYVPEVDADWLRRQEAAASLRYFDYDWSLNDLAHH
jgi:hypothetical protein